MSSDQSDPLVRTTDPRDWETSFFPEKHDESTSDEESEDKTKQKLKKLKERTKTLQNRNFKSSKISDNHLSGSTMPKPSVPSLSKTSLCQKKSSGDDSVITWATSSTQSSRNSRSTSLPTLDDEATISLMNPFNSSNKEMGSSAKNSFDVNFFNPNTDVFARFDPLCNNNTNNVVNDFAPFVNANKFSPLNYDITTVSNNHGNPFYNSNQVPKANVNGNNAKTSFSGEEERGDNKENKNKNKKEIHKKDESDNNSSSSSDDDSKDKNPDYDSRLEKPKSKNNGDSKPYKHKRRATAPTKSINKVQNELKEQRIIDPPKPHGGLDNIRSASSQTTTKVTAKPLYDVLPELERGTAFLKYGKHGYPHFRQFQISPDHSTLQWFSKNKKLEESSILIKDIDEVLPGQSSKEFKRIGWNTLEPASFCVHYDHHTKSLSLVAKSIDEMKMWVQALEFLRNKARRGDNLANILKVDVSVDFKDRNRPSTKPHSGKFLRSDDPSIKRNVDPLLQQKLREDMAILDKKFRDVAALSRDPIISKSQEYNSIQRIVSDIEERMCELKEEIERTRDTKIAQNDVWRIKVDMEGLKEKIQVLIHENRAKQRRWSVYF